jgi:hypothetical protein
MGEYIRVGNIAAMDNKAIFREALTKSGAIEAIQKRKLVSLVSCRPRLIGWLTKTAGPQYSLLAAENIHQSHHW